MKNKFTSDPKLFSKIVSESICFVDIFKAYDINYKSYPTAYYKMVKKAISDLCIDISHFDANKGRARQVKSNAHTLDDILNNRASSTGYSLKPKLYSAKLKTPICEECGQTEIWNGKPLVLQLEHIDGNNSNNLLENLKILCPNCHTQTPTYSRKKKLVLPPGFEPGTDPL